MSKRKVWFWIVGAFVLLLVVFFVGGMGVLGRLPWQRGNLYADPQGRFTIEVDPSWEEVETDGRYTQFKVPDPPVNIYLLVLNSGTVDEAFSQAMEVVEFDPALLGGDSFTTFGDWQAYQQEDAAGLSYALAGQIVGDKAYVLMVKTDFFLTEADLEHFHTRYMRLAIRLLEQLKEHMPPQMENQLFSEMAADLVQEYASVARSQGLSTEKRLEMVQDLLKDEGFDIEWEQVGNNYHIREVSCPYLHVGQNHPEVCHIDQTLISTVLELPAEKIRCILDGDNYSTYVVPSVMPEFQPSEDIQ